LPTFLVSFIFDIGDYSNHIGLYRCCTYGRAVENL